MFNNIENIEVVSSFHKAGRTRIKVENKKCHGFIIRIKGNMLYKFNGFEIPANEGEVIFVPKGSTYTATALSEDVLYTSLNFQADFKKEPPPEHYSLDGFYDADYISNCFTDMWNLGTASEKYKCISLFYNLLSYVSELENKKADENNNFGIINPAISYLKEHIFDCKLKPGRLHELCGISNTYFRQLFVLKYGANPTDYIISKRISHARAIILSGDFETIEEVSRSVGYNDPLYFGKVFKKFYGVCPSELNKN